MAQFDDEARARAVHATPEPLVLLDMIERVNDLPDAQITVQGTWDHNDCGHDRARADDPECPECGAELSDGDG